MAFYFLVERGPRPGLQLELADGLPQVMGRSGTADLPLPAEDREVDPRHVEIVADAARVHVRALPNTSPFLVNDRVMQQDAELAPGDCLQLGRTTLRLLTDERAGALESNDEEPEPLSVRDIVASVRALRAEPWRVAPQSAPLTDPLVEPDEELLRCTGCGKPGIKPPRPDLWDAAWLCAVCAKGRRQQLLGMPARIGQFDVLRPIGHGGMGAVYEGVARDSGLHVAIKVLQHARGTSEKVIQRFAREQQIAKALRHPNIVCCYDVGTWEGSLFIASEFVSGGDAVSISSPTSSIQQVLWLGADLFRALAYGHDLGIVHRDVKPANLLLCRVGPEATLRGKLSDFGLAKGRGGAITASNEAGGSLLTIGPEQLQDFVNVGPHGDLYSAAATVFWLLTADTPLVLPTRPGHATFEQKAQAIIDPRRKKLRELRPEVPEQVAELIDSLVTHDPSHRMKMQAREIGVALNAIASRIARRSSRRRPSEAVLSALSSLSEPEGATGQTDVVSAHHFKEALETVELSIRMLERAVERAASNVRVAVAADDTVAVDRAISDHDRAQADLEQLLSRWERLVESPSHD